MRSGLLLFLVLSLALLGGRSLAAEASDKRFCADAAPNIVVYLDVTSPYDDTDKASLVDGISRIFEGLDGGTRLAVRTIEDAHTSSHHLLDICIPFCTSEGFFADLLSSCTEGVVINEKKRQRRLISATLVEKMQARSELAHSAIVQTIALSSSEEFIEKRANTIYVFSDMIENSEYEPGAAFFKDKNSKLIERLSGDGLIPDLMGATVKVFGIGRGGGAGRTPLPQERLNKLEDFWRLFFAASGASATLQQNLSN